LNNGKIVAQAVRTRVVAGIEADNQLFIRKLWQFAYNF